MKNTCNLLLILFWLTRLSAQEPDENKYIVFKLKYANDTTTVDGIEWKRENLSAGFVPNNTNMRYEIRPISDSIAGLYLWEENEFILQEDIHYSGWAMRRVDRSIIFSEFRLTDFNMDGYGDLICWADSNVNGNIWTLIYLYDPEQRKLVKLYNVAEGTDIWDAPYYDPHKKVIHCELFSSAFGISAESTFKLIKTETLPVEKTEWDTMQQKYIVTKKYIGKEKKWKLVSSRKERI